MSEQALREIRDAINQQTIVLAAAILRAGEQTSTSANTQSNAIARATEMLQAARGIARL